MKLRVPLTVVTCLIAASVLLPPAADAQGRRGGRAARPAPAGAARPRTAVAARPRAAVARPRVTATTVVRPRVNTATVVRPRVNTTVVRPRVNVAVGRQRVVGPRVGTAVARPRAGRAVVVRPRTIVVRPSAALVLGSYAYRPFIYSSGYYGYRSSYYYGYPYASYGYPGGYGYYSSYSQWPPYYGYGRGYDLSGSLRLQVAPRETEVFIDGYYAGPVDDFDGIFQRLRLEPGDHDLELYLDGHRPFQLKVYLQPGRTFNVRHAMEPLGAGEALPLRPSGAPLPPPGTGPGPASRSAPGRENELAANAEAGFGALALRVQPGDATVTIDGERWEGAPDDERLVVQLGAGVHHIEIRKDGYRAYLTDVTVRSGDTITLNVAMTPNR